MSNIIVKVPDLGGSENVEIIEISVAVGDRVDVEQDLIVLETDKATMEVPSSHAGVVTELLVKVGDTVSEGSDILALTSESSGVAEGDEQPATEAAVEPAEKAASAAEEPAPEPTSSASITIELTVPDLGGATDVDIIELSVEPGTRVDAEDSLLVLETDKASMDVPAPQSGTLVEFKVAVGDKVNEGDVYAVLTTSNSETTTVAAPASESAPEPVAEKPASAPAPAKAEPAQDVESKAVVEGKDVYAGPSSRRLARQLGVDLTKVKGSGARNRITKDDIRAYVKGLVQQAESGQVAVTSGSGIPAVPEIDFSQFGEIDLQPMSKIKKLTAANMSRAWLNVPHVTQFDEADMSDLDAFRNDMKAEAERRGVKLTPMPFLIKAAAMALRAEPSFNVSLHADGEHMVQKHYVHIGMAVDTPNGLVVPVIRDADQKGIWQLAEESNELAAKARAGKLKAAEMQGGCFTISSLGAMGGTGFTPIVNTPEVAIMGVSKAQIKPIWNGKEFEPRNMLPLAVSYDHRAINGADCGRFFTTLVAMISDIRRLVL
jgi:pyruvate dehydrogenase E2 component (dihydrolipoamide acetyltransferase)